MPHYAKVNENRVVNVLVAEEEFFDTYVDTSPGQWIQTSYNTHGGVHANDGTPLRKNYASIGMIYDSNRDAFYDQKPFNSWTLDENTCLWNPPIEYPTDGNDYKWNEETTSWDAV